MKNAKKYRTTYESMSAESFSKWGYHYPPRTWEELYAWDNASFNKYLKDLEDGPKKTKSYLSLLDSSKDFGPYIVFENLDFQLLNDVLYQNSRQQLLNYGMMSSGTDHCHLLMNVLNSFSCNDFEVISHFFPQSLSHAKGTYYTEVAVNLLKVLFFKEEDLKTEAMNKADTFLTKKITAWESSVVKYFQALVMRNARSASASLQAACTAYQKMEHSVGKLANQLATCFASEIHGLYRFARIVDNELFVKIEMPKHDCFFKGFEAWQQANGYPVGKLFYAYPPEMDYMNRLLKAPLPTMTLHNPYPTGNKLYKDVEQFAQDLTDNVNRMP